MALFTKKSQKRRARERNEDREQRKIERTLKKEARWYCKRIIEVASRYGADYRHTEYDTDLSGKQVRYREIDKIKISEVWSSPTQHFFKIDSFRLPYRVSLALLASDELIDIIGGSTYRNVSYVKEDNRYGSWFVLEREGVIGGVPKQFSFGESIREIPKSAKPLTYVVGVGRKGQIVTDDLTRAHHLFIAGATGGGKSVFVNQMISLIAMRADPRRVKFVMIDLKRGTELQDYRSLPHMWDTSQPIITEPKEVATVLEKLQSEVDKRYSLFAGFGVRDVAGWNYRHHAIDEKLPLIVVMFDEIAQVLSAPAEMGALKKQVELQLYSLLSISRAAGVHFVISTQTINKDIMKAYIKTNVPSRLCFATSSIAESIIVLGSGHAHKLEPAGRAAYRRGAHVYIVQAPYISSRGIKEAVKLAIRRWGAGDEVPSSEIGPHDLIRYSLENLGGSMAWRPLYDEFKRKGMGQPRIKSMLRDMNDQTFVVDGQIFRIEIPDGQQNRVATRVEPNGHKIKDLVASH